MKILLVTIAIISLACTASYRAVLTITPTNLPDVTGATYKIDPFLNTAIQLQTMGKEKSIEILKKISTIEKQDMKIIVLCRMLFVAKQDQPFRAPMLGLPNNLGRSKTNDWPLTPIEIVDGVPFLVVNGYMLAGQAESGAMYLDYCINNCDWNSNLYQIKNRQQKQQALDKFFADPRWQEAIPKVFLSAQIA